MCPKPSVSKTSVGTFDDCERKWALSYHWRDLPVEVRPEIAFEAKLMPFEAFAGQVVDDVITDTLRNFEATGWEVDYKAKAQSFVKEYLDESTSWFIAHREHREPPRLRRQPLDRYYFEEPFTPDERTRLRETILSCLENFFNSDIPGTLESHERRFWKMPPRGETPWFFADNVPVWAKYDFAIVAPGRTQIFDWKTGKVSERSEEAAREQLHTYALYAMDEWDSRPEEIELNVVWLSLGPNQIMSERVDLARLRTLKEKWQERHALLLERQRSLGRDPRRLLELFPMTGIEKGRCRYCQFRSCEGYRTSVLSSANAAAEAAKKEGFSGS